MEWYSNSILLSEFMLMVIFISLIVLVSIILANLEKITETLNQVTNLLEIFNSSDIDLSETVSHIDEINYKLSELSEKLAPFL